MSIAMQEVVTAPTNDVAIPFKNVTYLTDPKFGSREIMGYINVMDLPRNLPSFNVRTPKLNGIYNKIIEALHTVKMAFHLNNRGIIAIAESVKVEDNVVRVKFGNGGIMDGLRTYTILTTERNESCKDQYVFMRIRTQINKPLWGDMAEGLNTSGAVKAISIMNFRKKFDFLKDALEGASFFNRIAWEEGDTGPGKIDAKIVLSAMTAMNIGLFPNTGKISDQPLVAYHKQHMLATFEDNKETYEALAPLAKDICGLYDYIALKLGEFYNQGKKRRDFSFVPFVEGTIKEGKAHSTLFTNQAATYRINEPVILPILASLRVCLRKDSKGNFVWIGGSVETAIRLFREIAYDAVETIGRIMQEQKKNDHYIARQSSVWRELYLLAKDKYLETRQS